jgi:nitrous oxidase accessory protein NosD
MVTYYNVSNNYFDGKLGTPGIRASYSENNNFSQNIFTDVEESIKIQRGISNIITKNVISNGNSGINIYDRSYGNIIADNSITGELDYGLMICGSVGNNIERNFFYNNTVGFYIANTQIIWLSQLVNKSLKVNTFSQNDVVNNNLSVRAQWSYSVPMSKDLLTESHKMPICLYANYWSDYNGTDSKGDGVGDTPYYTTDRFYVDSYPLMAPTYIRNVTLTPPKITTIDELHNEELNELRSGGIVGQNFSRILANAILYGSIILIAIGLSLVIYFKKRSRDHNK